MSTEEMDTGDFGFGNGGPDDRGPEKSGAGNSGAGNGHHREFLLDSDSWLDRVGEESDVIVTSRVRLARNLPGVPFPSRAHEDDLRSVIAQVREALADLGSRHDFEVLDLENLDSGARAFLRENHLISAEFEKGGHHRMVALDPEFKLGLMVNEEDHLRLYSFCTGFGIEEALDEAFELDAALSDIIPQAWHPEWGYLTACPTNTGTGLRASAMLHLPALKMTQRIQELTDYIPDFGLTVRGFYGENSEFLGDFFQISNERTLGKSEERIVEELAGVAREIADKERDAREELFSGRETTVDDMVQRSYALLTNARLMNSAEAQKLLSKLRLGIDRGYFPFLTHERLTAIFVHIQPGHLVYRQSDAQETEQRDEIRARLLRSWLVPNKTSEN